MSGNAERAAASRLSQGSPGTPLALPLTFNDPTRPLHRSPRPELMQIKRVPSMKIAIRFDEGRGGRGGNGGDRIITSSQANSRAGERLRASPTTISLPRRHYCDYAAESDKANWNE